MMFSVEFEISWEEWARETEPETPVGSFHSKHSALSQIWDESDPPEQPHFVAVLLDRVPILVLPTAI